VAKTWFQKAVWWLTGWFRRQFVGYKDGTIGSVVANKLVQKAVYG